MALPICGPCAARRVLCASCERKLADGRLNIFEVEVSRVLYELLKDEADFTHAVDTDELIIIITRGEDVGKLIGRGGANLKVLSERLGKRVKVIGRDSFSDTVTALIAPARVRGINKVLRPGGGAAFRVRVEREDRDKLRLPLKDLQKLVCAATDMELEMAFD
jgi:transcription antitermination factor NusA-like protein